MAEEHFIETGAHTFYGEYIYDQIIPQDHFFRKLNDMLDWRNYSKKMMRWYQGRAQSGYSLCYLSAYLPHAQKGCQQADMGCFESQAHLSAGLARTLYHRTQIWRMQAPTWLGTLSLSRIGTL